MTPRNPSTRQIVAFDDDLLIPPPRKAQRWYCNKCGEPTGEPEPGMLSIDPRYAIGHCECTKPRMNRKSGYKHEMVALTADFAWDPDKYRSKQEAHSEELAYERQASGQSIKIEDQRRAARYRARNGLPDPERL